ncbi:MMPL family transporter [Nonomuraea dietziae]|uniref:MMPL family transporter n=1 Tax=Nonomuraea dietziae TaxID=65515 RepID=UPI0033EDF46D
MPVAGRLPGYHRAARINLYPVADPQSRQARDLASGPVRAAVAQHTPAGTTAHVGGTPAIIADISTAVDHDLRIVFPVAVALVALILLLLLRSLLAPVILMLSVGLGFAATLGVDPTGSRPTEAAGTTSVTSR